MRNTYTTEQDKNMALLDIPTTNSTILREVDDEKFEEVHLHADGAAQIVDDGKTFETIKRMTFNCALGRNTYSTGSHRIRIKLHHGSAFVGIRSHHVRVEPDEQGMYDRTPSIYGWCSD